MLQHFNHLFWLPQCVYFFQLDSTNQLQNVSLCCSDYKGILKITEWNIIIKTISFNIHDIKKILNRFIVGKFRVFKIQQPIKFIYTIWKWEIWITYFHSWYIHIEVVNINISYIEQILSVYSAETKIFYKHTISASINQVQSLLNIFLHNIWCNIFSKKQITLQDKLKSIGNDYSVYENVFFSLMWKKLLTKTWIEFTFQKFQCTIVIPAYNTEHTLKKLLESIHQQSIFDEGSYDVQVIIDDWSKIPIKSLFMNKQFVFELKIIRSESNRWRAQSRNIWLWYAKFDNIILLDADVILPYNYLKEMLYRITIFPRSIFMSFRKNINNNKISMWDIQKHLCKPKYCNDHRLRRDVMIWQLSYYPIHENKRIYLLKDSDYFKKLGNGNIYWLYDLPLTVSTHNLCYNRKYNPQLFCEKFSGWGMEDSFFGAEAIYNGSFIIPVLSTWVYHIKHVITKINTIQKEQQLKGNLTIYQQLLNQHDERILKN